MKNIYRFLIVMSTVLSLCCCQDPFEDGVFKAYDEAPMGEYLQNDEDYSMWVALLKKVDVFNALNLGSFEFTCFAAKNDAVQAYLEKHGYESIEDIPLDELDYLMRYHIISGKKYLNSDLLLKLSFPTVSGDYLTAGVDLDTELRYIDNGEGKEKSFIIEKDIRVSNGIIHCLDRMLEPITMTVWDIVSGNTRYSIFTDALKATGLDQWLDRAYVEINDVRIRDMKSVFVVPNEIFAARDIADFNALKVFFGNEDPSSEDSEMYQWMLYHLFDKLVDYAELTTFPSGYKSMIYYTMSKRKGLSVLDADGMITINPESEGESFHINDAKRDIPANNGYVHEIDNLGLLPERMSHYVVLWEPTDKKEFHIIPFYRMAKVSGDETTTYSLVDNELEVEGIRWEAIPETKAKVWYTNEYANNGRYLNSDALHWNLGTIGWLEMDVPVLPLGKYQVWCEKYNKGADGGKGYTMFDDQYINDNEVNFATGAEYAVWKTFNLLKEETHLVRFTVGSSAGVFGVDKFVFVPVE